MQRKKSLTVRVYRCIDCGYTWNERKGRNIEKCPKCGGKMILIDKFKTRRLSFKGLKSLKRRIKRKGSPKEIFRWFSRMAKDDEFAELLDDIVRRNRKDWMLEKNQKFGERT